MRKHDRDSLVFHGEFMGIVVLLGLLMLATSGCSLFRTRSRPIPDTPFDLSATALSSEEIELKWKYLADQQDGFYIFRKDLGDFQKIFILEGNATLCVDSPLDPETTYSYYMVAYNQAGESDPSETVSATTPAEAELLGYDVTENYLWYEDEWCTIVEGSVKNNTRRILVIWVKVKLFNYEEVLVATEGDFVNNVEPLEAGSFRVLYEGERIKFVEVWIDDYY